MLLAALSQIQAQVEHVFIYSTRCEAQIAAGGCVLEVVVGRVRHWTGNAVDGQGGCELNVVGRRL